MTWTIEEARSVPCPKCDAQIAHPCIYTGKKAASRMRAGRSHQERIEVMVNARRAGKRHVSDDFDVIE